MNDGCSYVRTLRTLIAAGAATQAALQARENERGIENPRPVAKTT